MSHPSMPSTCETGGTSLGVPDAAIASPLPFPKKKACGQRSRQLTRANNIKPLKGSHDLTRVFSGSKVFVLNIGRNLTSLTSLTNLTNFL